MWPVALRRVRDGESFRTLDLFLEVETRGCYDEEAVGEQGRRCNRRTGRKYPAQGGARKGIFETGGSFTGGSFTGGLVFVAL